MSSKIPALSHNAVFKWKSSSQLVSWHIKHMGMQIFQSILIELAIFIVHFLVALNLKHTLFVQSTPLQLAKCQCGNCSKNESES